MRKLLHLFFCSTAVTFLFGLGQTAYAAIDPAAAVVKVRTVCTDNGIALDDCFESMAALTDWMANIRKPNATSPLRVEIGPGTYAEDVFITCNSAAGYTGYTSFEGAGSSQTIINGFGSANSTPLNVNNCTEMNFSHLKITTRFYGGVHWNGGGNSRWTDVQVIGAGRAWYEETCGATPGNHYWMGSKLVATAVFSVAETYRATCDESWFLGSEVTVSVPSDAYPANGGAVTATDAGIIHVYGSVLRTLVDGPTMGNNVPAASVGYGRSGGTIHIHGTGIDGISTTGQNITALYAGPGGMLHTNETAYNLSTTGVVTRISNQGGDVHAPYLWEGRPEAPNITSANGADMAVVTNTTDGQPHLVIYSTACASKWFDTVAKACR
jgi:hypothetical protein